MARTVRNQAVRNQTAWGRKGWRGTVGMRKVWLAAVVGVVLLAGSASPAAADHQASYWEGGCWAGEQTTVIPIAISTTHFDVKEHRDGSQRLRCHFRDLPAYVAWDAPGNERNEEYHAPARAVRTALVGFCMRGDHDYAESSYFLIRPNGTGMLVCEWHHPYPY